MNDNDEFDLVERLGPRHPMLLSFVRELFAHSDSEDLLRQLSESDTSDTTSTKRRRIKVVPPVC